jgi:3-oxoacyl-[acyl-carrier protein] reductase
MVLALANAGIRVVATAARERAEVEAVAEETRRICGESRVLPVVADVPGQTNAARSLNWQPTALEGSTSWSTMPVAA